MSEIGMRRTVIATQVGELEGQDLMWALTCLIARSKELGKVITVECVPQQPFAMGNYVMVPDIRDAR